MALQDQLHDLYLLDQRLRGLRSRLDSALRRQSAQQTRLDQLRQQHQELESQRKQLQAHTTTLEKQASEVETRIARQRQQMNTVTTNKEYSALLVEVNTLKIEKGKLEDQALEQMSEVEATQARLDELAEKIAAQEKLVQGAERDVAEARADVGDKLEQVESERAIAAEQIPPDVLAGFDRLAETYEGEAMAEVEEQDRRRREYTCGGCYMQLPVERVNTLLRRPDETVRCPSCGRYLYLANDLRTALAPK